MNRAVGFALAALVALGGAASEAATLLGEPQRMGEGTARTYAEIGADGAPQAIGILISELGFRGLPQLRNTSSRCFDLNGNQRIDDRSECEGDLELKLSLPEALTKRSDVPFRWVGLNFNPEGHPPEPWSVPHFDFHFYIASRAEIAGIRVGPCPFFINCDDRKRAFLPVPEKYVAEDHINVDAAVSMMGNHLIDKRTPEFGDPPKPFTHTWIFGAYDGHITFYEPMITLAFLKSRPDVCTPIRQPAAREQAGYYPTEYCIRYDGERAGYTISLEGLVRRAAD
jgi:hypothetical protein